MMLDGDLLAANSRITRDALARIVSRYIVHRYIYQVLRKAWRQEILLLHIASG